MPLHSTQISPKSDFYTPHILSSTVNPKMSKQSLLDTGSSTVENLYADQSVDKESTVVLVDGVSGALDETLDRSDRIRPFGYSYSKLAQPSYSEFFVPDKMNLHSIRLRTDLNEIMNSFSTQVNDELGVIRYSAETERKKLHRPAASATYHKRTCQIL